MCGRDVSGWGCIGRDGDRALGHGSSGDSSPGTDQGKDSVAGRHDRSPARQPGATAVGQVIDAGSILRVGSGASSRDPTGQRTWLCARYEQDEAGDAREHNHDAGRDPDPSGFDSNEGRCAGRSR